MKIGILTYHRAHNYGAVLQAVASRYFLKKMNHEVFYIDYFPDYHKKWYTLPRKSWFWKVRHPILWKNLKKLLPTMQKRMDAFGAFQEKYILPYSKSLSESYDAILYGSDQIWRKQPGLGNYNPVYFGKNDFPAKKHFAYAASMKGIPDNDTDKNYLKELLSNLDYIAVREKPLKALVDELGFNANLVLDPTLLLTADDWNSALSIKTFENRAPYLLYYSVRPNAFDFNVVKDFAKRKGLDVFSLHGNVLDLDSEESSSTKDPAQMVELIRNASFVITSSFHGMVFAINYHKPFYAYSDYAVERLSSILEKLDLQDRYIDGKKRIPDEVKSIDYSEVDLKMSQLRKSSIEYLSNCVRD